MRLEVEVLAHQALSFLPIGDDVQVTLVHRIPASRCASEVEHWASIGVEGQDVALAQRAQPACTVSQRERLLLLPILVNAGSSPTLNAL